MKKEDANRILFFNAISIVAIVSIVSIDAFETKFAMSKKFTLLTPDGSHRVLLHTCCAPCSSAIIESMMQHGIEPAELRPANRRGNAVILGSGL